MCPEESNDEKLDFLKNFIKPDAEKNTINPIIRYDTTTFLRDLLVRNTNIASHESPQSSQVSVWWESAKKDGRLTEIRMNEEVTIPINADRPVFYTGGLHGCLVYLEVDPDNKTARFGHIDTTQAAKRFQEWQQLATKKHSVLLVPDIPPFQKLTGEHVYKYDLNLNFTPDGFAEGMALQESPHLQSACVYLEMNDQSVTGYLNAFERVQNAKWPPTYLPKHIAKSLNFKW